MNYFKTLASNSVSTAVNNAGFSAILTKPQQVIKTLIIKNKDSTLKYLNLNNGSYSNWIKTKLTSTKKNFKTQIDTAAKRTYSTIPPDADQEDMYIWNKRSRALIVRPILFTIATGVISYSAAEYYRYHKFAIRSKVKEWKHKFYKTIGYTPKPSQEIIPVKYRIDKVGFLEETLIGLRQRIRDITPAQKTLASILSINTAIFLLWRFPIFGHHFMSKHFLHSAFSGRTYTMLTCAFSHHAGWHFLANSIAFWSFGQVAHAVMGREYFLATVTTSAATSSLAAHLWDALLQRRIPGLGSSGFVIALVGITAMYFPNEQMLLFFVIPVPLLAGVKGLAVFDAVGLTGIYGRLFGWNLGHHAHLGGLASGVGFYNLQKPSVTRQIRSYIPIEILKYYDSYVNYLRK